MENPSHNEPILLGSTFSLGKIRRKVIIEPISLEMAREILASRQFVSFWGHENTMAVATRVLGVDVTPLGGRTARPQMALFRIFTNIWRRLNSGGAVVRPQLALTPEGFPTLGGMIFRECIVLSPIIDRRPSIGEEVSEAEIKGWDPLRIVWPEDEIKVGRT